MRTLVPGNFSLLPRLSSGFTLVEILLVLLIVGIVAGATLPTVSFGQVSARDEAQRLATLIEHAQVMASTLGTPIGLEIAPDHYEFLRGPGNSSPTESGPLFKRHQLAAGITVEAQADPDSGPTAPRIIRFPPTGYPNKFSIRVFGAGHAWLVTGNLAGRVLVENKDSAP